MEFTQKANYTFDDLVRIMQLLRTPQGCPWDKKQTHRSIRQNFIEETYEVVEAIDKEDTELLKEELAPLDGYALLQLIAKKRGMLMAGGQADTLRAANILLDEYRSAKLGTITLERAENV